MKFTGIDETVGNTPLVPLNFLQPAAAAQVWVKLESQNPAGSVKDRPALYMVRAAEKEGLLPENGTIIEPTSGNTGLALAMLAAAQGYRCILVMPDTMSVERQRLARAFGAEVLLTPGDEGMSGSVALAEKLVLEKGYYMPNQFANEENVRAHYETTGPEIFRDMAGEVDAFVAGVGTGGTITGVGKYLKERIPKVFIAAVEPALSPLLSGGAAGSHGIQGIGANFIPKILRREVIDEIISVEDEDARSTTRALGAKEGILCGISAGANVFAALRIARKLGPGKNVVTVLPDTGERYLSTPLFAGEEQ
ncbi:MAG TPA: cysteine synthase A [Firmicutes bacterium]|nr:cysteine synthase A [Bacillota bacterium]